MTDTLIKELIAAVVREEMKDMCASTTMPQSVYCAKFDVSLEAIRQRLTKGIWQMGREVLEVKGAGRYIDLRAVDAWARKQGGSHFLAA